MDKILQSIADFCGSENQGGILAVRYISTAWINQNLYEPMVGPVYGQTFEVALQPTYDWLTMPLLPKGRGWKEKGIFSKQGDHYQQTVEGTIPRRTEALVAELRKMQRHRFILRIEDRNGQDWILGTFATPFRILVDFSTGDNPSGSNGIKIRFYCDTLQPAPAYDPPLVVL